MRFLNSKDDIRLIFSRQLIIQLRLKKSGQNAIKRHEFYQFTLSRANEIPFK